jgi:hypothetical protein
MFRHRLRYYLSYLKPVPRYELQFATLMCNCARRRHTLLAVESRPSIDDFGGTSKMPQIDIGFEVSIGEYELPGPPNAYSLSGYKEWRGGPLQ